MEVCAAYFAGGRGHKFSTDRFETRRIRRLGQDHYNKLTSSRTLPTVVLCVCLGLLTPSAFAQGELRFCLRSEPKTFDPLQVEDDASVAIRYLTGGTLVRMNRQSQVLEPELAQSWKVSKDGKQITFKLRSGISFSDGTPFSAEDVAYTVQRSMDPSLHSPTGDAFPLDPVL